MLIDGGKIFKEDTPAGLIDEIGQFKVEYEDGDRMKAEFFKDLPAAKSRAAGIDEACAACFLPRWRTYFPLHQQGGGRMEITTILWREWLFLKRRF